MRIASNELSSRPVAQSPAAGVLQDLEAYFLSVAPAGEDPAADVTREIAIEDVSASAKTGVDQAVEEIEGRTFEGTDYSAWVNSIYEVRAPENQGGALVGYLVSGGGSGEPDYVDMVNLGVDLQGNIVSRDEAEY
jgi:hypothetical protein